jgi:hypothetical protein
LTLPFLIGIPLSAIGLLLLVQGERLRAERWIRVLFRMVSAALILSVALFVTFPPDGAHSAEAGIARSILCVSPVCLALLLSVAMAALTFARFESLSLKHRIMGLVFGGLSLLGFGTALVIGFPWQMLVIAGLSATGLACVRWRKRRRARRAEALLNPAVGAAAPALAATPPEPTVPVAKPPKPPRVRKPLCGILAWLLPLSAPPAGYLILRLCDREGGAAIACFVPAAWALIPLPVALCLSPAVRKSPLRILAFLLPPTTLFGLMITVHGGGDNGTGFIGWAYLALALLPLLAGLCAAPILALASLWRRERYPALAVVPLVLYGASLVFYVIVLAFG